LVLEVQVPRAEGKIDDRAADPDILDGVAAAAAAAVAVAAAAGAVEVAVADGVAVATRSWVVDYSFVLVESYDHCICYQEPETGREQWMGQNCNVGGRCGIAEARNSGLPVEAASN
jgi:hypothetical protein